MAACVRVTSELEVVVRSARGSCAVGDSPPLARACTRACLAFPFAAGLLACCSSIITRARLVVCLAMQIFPSFLGETFVTGGTDHNQGAIGYAATYVQPIIINRSRGSRDQQARP